MLSRNLTIRASLNCTLERFEQCRGLSNFTYVRTYVDNSVSFPYGTLRVLRVKSLKFRKFELRATLVLEAELLTLSFEACDLELLIIGGQKCSDERILTGWNDELRFNS